MFKFKITHKYIIAIIEFLSVSNFYIYFQTSISNIDFFYILQTIFKFKSPFSHKYQTFRSYNLEFKKYL